MPVAPDFPDLQHLRMPAAHRALLSALWRAVPAEFGTPATAAGWVAREFHRRAGYLIGAATAFAGQPWDVPLFGDPDGEEIRRRAEAVRKGRLRAGGRLHTTAEQGGRLAKDWGNHCGKVGGWRMSSITGVAR